MDFLQFVQVQIMSSDHHEQVRLASEALDAFTDAFNACDLRRMDQALHFPHLMLSGGDTLIWDQAGQHPPDFFTHLLATGWRKTRYESRTAVCVTPNKVHFVVEYTRRNERDQELSRHTNLWAVTLKQDRWGIALRSY